jgi:hypothetical protein
MNIKKAWQWIRDEKRAVWGEYGLVALIILLPLLVPGYILTLDLVFTPSFDWPTQLTNTYPLEVVLWLLHHVLPGDIIEKIILFAILVLSGVGMHTLIRSINIKGKFHADIWRIALYFGGLLYMINPFTYSRFMAGQWMVLLGYALLPFFIRALLQLITLPSRKSALRVAIWSLVIVIVSIHHGGMLIILGTIVPLLASVFGYWRDRQHLKQFMLWSSLGGALVFVLTSFWSIPALLGNATIASSLGQFDQSHFEAFATSGGNTLAALADVVRFQGFWVEDRQFFLLPQTMTPLWGLVFMLIWLLVIIGGVKAWRSHRMVVGLGAACILIGIILAATPLIAWLSGYLPFLSGYREPHKFVNFIVIGYCLLGVFGVAHIASWASSRFKELGEQIVVAVCLLLPIAVTPTMLWGFAGQLSPRAYPEGWYQMDRKLTASSGVKKVLFLPWHQYTTFAFSGRIIATPADKFFKVPIVASNDPEFKSISPTVPDSGKEMINEAFKDKTKLVKVLKEQGITHILLAKEKDAGDYAYLNSLRGVVRTDVNSDMILYEVK